MSSASVEPTRPRRGVKRQPPLRVRLDREAVSSLVATGTAAGLDVVGTCRATQWGHTRSTLETRRGDGFADSMAFTYKNPARSTDPTRVMKRASTLIVGALSYVQTLDELPPNDLGVRAQVARYATADHYGRLAAALDVVAAELRARGARAVVVLDRNDIVDREAAWRSGIGWYGKNSLILSPGLGSWIVLGSVVTDAELVDVTPQPVSDHCGPCRRCIDACPTGAIVADGVVDAGRCLSWLLQARGSFPVEFREALGDRIYGCDDCQLVCPPSRTVSMRETRVGTARADDDPGRWLDALELLGLDDAALLDRCGRWYIADRNPNIIRRNLLIVVGNAASPNDARARAAVARFERSTDPVLAEHARWAADRLAARRAEVAGVTGICDGGPRQ